MRKTLALMLIVAFAALPALAHGGKSHNVMGTVKSVDEDRLTVTAIDGEDRTIVLTDDTVYEKGDKSAGKSDLVAGVRVSVHLTEDDTTAVKVRIAPEAHSH